ncbi:neuroglobin-like [Adelges cooleyi]|uniref:neuroglobin-like n=1 Tax=Adelges cooleyi TaxID=133065 RepID=UPI00217F7A58|nr:neuroglobin-like [Adelges cooleyi]XP_050443511.1 neuroglobin-like [Adelges cooleyi]XP_050443512.1 neuroglobin-like [Adelges cooleyi]
MELTNEQISEFQRTFPIVIPDPSKLVETMLLELFKTHREYLSLFKKLSDVSYEKLATSPEFQLHAELVGSALRAVVDLLDKPDELKSVLFKLGAKHKKYGVTPEHIQNLGDILIGLVTDAIGEGQPQLLSLYKTTLAMVLNALSEACV